MACYHLFEEKMKADGSIPPDYDVVRRRFARDVEGHFKYAWSHLDEAEQQTVRWLAEGRLDEVTRKALHRLEEKCLVYRDDIFSTVFAEFVLERKRKRRWIATEEDIRRYG
jgi:hypothetical protein